MALTDKLTAIGDAIRTKTGSTDLLTLDAMPTAISGIETGSGEGGSLYDYIPEEVFTITQGNEYRFYGGHWDWFITKYKDKIHTNNLYGRYIFANSELEEIPLEINVGKETSAGDVSYIFYGCYNLKTVPYLYGYIGGLNHWLDNCYMITGFPEDYADKFYINNESTSVPLSYLFYNCRSLREIPDKLNMKLVSNGTGNSYSPYNYRYNSCHTLNEVRNLPICGTTGATANLFSNTFFYTTRVKNILFLTQEDGTPYTANWKTQTIDLTYNVGYSSNSYVSGILNYASGITADKEVKDDATYQALKDDPDWYTLNIAYSRYNHDSSVATINSLPDTSDYIASKGGTNTIKFKGASGELTDGGAINTLTEEEIAVATAKGWTVTLA